MDSASDKKHHRKQPKDSDSKKRSSPSSHRYDYPQHSNRSSTPSSSSHPPSSSSTDPETQRKHYWETIMHSPNTPPTPLDRYPYFKPTRGPTSFSTNPPSAPRHQTSSKSKTHHQTIKPLRAVPIAPSGPIIEPREENDGYRFKCPEEGCEQRFRHRSSRSRHKKNCHMRNANKNT